LDSSVRGISPSQQTLPDNKQPSQDTQIHTPGGIRTTKLQATNPRLRLRGHWDWLRLHFTKSMTAEPVLVKIIDRTHK